MSKFALLAMMMLGLMFPANAQTSVRSTLFILSTGCYKPMDAMELLAVEKERGENAADELGLRKAAERKCVLVAYFEEDLEGAPVENGMRKIHCYPYPGYDHVEIARLFSGFSRPAKQYMYILEPDK